MCETTLIGDIPEKAQLMIARQTPLRRLAKPSDVAGRGLPGVRRRWLHHRRHRCRQRRDGDAMRGSSRPSCCGAGGAGQGDSTMMLTQAVTALEKEAQPRTVKIGVSSSATVDLLNLPAQAWPAERCAHRSGGGNYDDPIGDIDLFAQAGVEQIVLLPFFDNLLPSFEAQLESLDPSIIDAKEAELRQRYRMVFDKARRAGDLSWHLPPHGQPGRCSGQDAVAMCWRASTQRCAMKPPLRECPRARYGSIVRAVGQGAAFDTRFYFRSKHPTPAPT
jgi:hypothetical protein